MSNQSIKTLLKTKNWEVSIRINGAGKPYIFVGADFIYKNSFCDYPIFYPHTKTIGWNYPERITKRVKKLVETHIFIGDYTDSQAVANYIAQYQ